MYGTYFIRMKCNYFHDSYPIRRYLLYIPLANQYISLSPTHHFQLIDCITVAWTFAYYNIAKKGKFILIIHDPSNKNASMWFPGKITFCYYRVLTEAYMYFITDWILDMTRLNDIYYIDKSHCEYSAYSIFHAC